MKENSKNRIALTGAGASVEALRQIAPDVMPVYPITPQTPIIEIYSKLKADGEVATEIIHVESEHSAISASVGASAGGARTVTATSSQGLALMNEILYIASGMRLPILMLVSARALSAPINIHGDHSDVMGARDAGWIQLFCENAQEVYDFTIMGMKLAEKVGLPVMVVMDGFNASHTVENLEILDDAVVAKFVGEYKPKISLLDFKNPMSFGPLALQNSYFEFKIDQENAMLETEKELEKIYKDFAKISGRKYDIFEDYFATKSEKVLVMMGSLSGTVKDVVDEKIKRGEKIGLLKLHLFRPFPFEKIGKILKKKKEVIVLDRAQSIGSNPPLYSEIVNSLHALDSKAKIKSYIYGLGGRDLSKEKIRNVLNNNKIKNKFIV